MPGDLTHLGAIAKNEAWILRAWADGPGGARVDAPDVAFTVGNALPGAGVVMISPSAPKTGDSLTAVWQSPPSDIDGDALSFIYLWEKDGASTTFSTDTVPAATIRGPQAWRVRARAVEIGDPSQIGPEATAEVQVGLLPPTAPVVTISPNPAVVGQPLHASILVDAVDPNGDPLTYVYAWSRNGAPPSVVGASVPAASVMPHDTWTVTVHARNTALSGPNAQASVSVANRIPSAGIATLTPLPFTAASNITVQTTGAIDPDGDPLSIAYAWTINGVPVVGSTSPTLNAGSFKRGDIIRATVTLSDGHGGMATTTTAPAVAANAVPSPPTAPTFVPPFPRGGDDARLTATHPAVDPDGDPVSLVVEWSLDDLSQGVSSTLVRTNSELKQGVWSARVAATDGIDTSPYVDVTASLTLCPTHVPLALTSSTAYDGLAYSMWDPRTCTVQGFANYYGQSVSFDPVTGTTVPSSIAYGPKIGESFNSRSWASAGATVNLAGNTFAIWASRPWSMETTAPPKQTLVTSLPTNTWTSGYAAGAAIHRDHAGHLVGHAIFDGKAANGTRVIRVYTADFTANTPPTSIAVSGISLPNLDKVAHHSSFHEPTNEILLGPVYTTKEIYAVNVTTGQTRIIPSNSQLQIGWTYDDWTRTFVGFAPYAGYGFGRLDPTTGRASWTSATKGFRYAPVPQFPGGDPAAQSAPAVVPATGETYVELKTSGVIRYTPADGSLRDITPVIPYATWQPGDGDNVVDVVARTATGTLIAYPMNDRGSLQSLARVFELDPATGDVSWLTPAAGSEAPNSPVDAAIAYDPQTDALLVHGGGLRDSVGVGETWSFSLTNRTWTQLSSSGPGRVSGRLMVDPVHHRLIFYGGTTPPMGPAPSWSHDVWAFDLANRSWSRLFDAGVGPMSYAVATASLDAAGDSMYVFGSYYHSCGAGICSVGHQLFRRDLTTGQWSGTGVSSAGLTPAITEIQGYGYNSWGLYSPIQGAPSERKFVYVGRTCTGSTTSGYGLVELSWDNPAPGWSFATQETTYKPPVGLIGIDAPASRVYSAFTPRYAAYRAMCSDGMLLTAPYHRTFEWP